RPFRVSPHADPHAVEVALAERARMGEQQHHRRVAHVGGAIHPPCTRAAVTSGGAGRPGIAVADLLAYDEKPGQTDHDPLQPRGPDARNVTDRRVWDR